MNTSPDTLSDVGVVVIGRNEGERLLRSLRSVSGDPGGTGFQPVYRPQVDSEAPSLLRSEDRQDACPTDQAAACVVYVDSGSTDGSVAAARELGAEVVELNLDLPFTAARARNAGLERLTQVAPDVRFVQMIDGDCEVVDGWLATARDALMADPKLAAVAGRRREIAPDASRWNRLIDMEWDTPVGEAAAIGGDAMFRLEALSQVDGYNPSLIAGEEPEMCVRMRAHGWTIRRIDAEMTRHDAALTSWKQWWKRNKRAGHAYAEGAAMHGKPPERHGVRDVKSAVAWGLVMPIIVLFCVALSVVGFVLSGPAGLALGVIWAVMAVGGVGLFALLIWKVYRYRRGRGDSTGDARAYAVWCVAGKTPEAMGVLTYWLNRLRGKSTRLMEYKK